MMLCSLLAALHFGSELHNAHPGITQLLIHVLHIQAAQSLLYLQAISAATASCMQLQVKTPWPSYMGTPTKNVVD